ncbi:MAG: hypothetical protein KJP21_08135 [Bacteroidia bacterium]|nr:hypothetical protein [Bacteroidia bacterium]
MEINGIEGLSEEQIVEEVREGAKFVFFTYTVSIIVMTFKRPTDVYFVRAGHSAVIKGLPQTILTLFLGWWGIPWGPIYTIGTLYRNLRGGRDVTEEILQSILDHKNSSAELEHLIEEEMKEEAEENN